MAGDARCGHPNKIPRCPCGGLVRHRPRYRARLRGHRQNYVLFMAEVEVEPATGKTRVLGATIVADIGTIGSRQAVLGQAWGGFSHAVGFALSENYEGMKKHASLGERAFRAAMMSLIRSRCCFMKRTARTGRTDRRAARKVFKARAMRPF
ncbi:MAG: molybdopterin cofactor-binding domain-containing protein [Bilophila sp.]